MPQPTRDAAANQGAAPGRAARPTRPPASRAAPPMAATDAPSRAPRKRATKVPTGSAVTTSAPAMGSYCQTSTTSSTDRNSAPTRAAKTRTKPRLAVTDPGTRGVGRVGPRPRTMGAATTTSAAAATGAWTMKIARQSSSWVRMPPRAGPRAAPIVPAHAHQARPDVSEPRSAASTGMAPASSRAAPTPWAHRAASRKPNEPAMPAASDDAANTTSPAAVRAPGLMRRPTSATSRAATVTTMA